MPNSPNNAPLIRTMLVGSGAVPLTAGHSIAVDTNYIPLGSCMLAAVPIIQKNRVIRHEYVAWMRSKRALVCARSVSNAIQI